MYFHPSYILRPFNIYFKIVNTFDTANPGNATNLASILKLASSLEPLFKPGIISFTSKLAYFVHSNLQVLSTHFQSWYVTFYYEPYSYGMLAENFDKYINNGQSLFFLTFHSLMVIVPIMFYT